MSPTSGLLHYNTITPVLKQTLLKLSGEELFAPFRLVGGTNLSLRFGHRKSIDIDLFSDAEYGSIDYSIIEEYLQRHFPYYLCNDRSGIVGFGRSYYIGSSAEDIIKLDLMYTDPFLLPAEVIDGISMASIADIIAMKMNVISRGGRKKDFWDIHMLLDYYPISEMIQLHAQRYEWEHHEAELIKNLSNFEIANDEPDPICLQQKDWDEIKLDFIDIIYKLENAPC
ncbi:MAG: nucleotidyl transferase AbiEii/AbiGii toxin family protein [Coprobacter sp.]|nr:nucleotidyl transferase AbiEii/AbiGii toxin family protein [Coprobacter sp.]